MIHVCYSNRVETLVKALGAALPPPGDADALFGGPWLVVPSRPLELYVDLELARQRGISGNVDTMSLRGAFARLCADATPEVVLIEKGHLVAELLAALCDPAILDGAPPFGPVAGYLRGAGTSGDAVDRRRADLAVALGALFDDWTRTQPERIAAWQPEGHGPHHGDDGDHGGGGDDHDAAARGPLELAERALWRALFGADGRFARRGAAEKKTYLTLPALLARGLDDGWRPPDSVHLFGLGDLQRGTQLALARLGARTKLRIYTVTPCGQFWEDLNTRRRARRPATPRQGRVRPRQLELLGVGGSGLAPEPAATMFDDADAENPFLRAWGHAGRETTRLLEQLTDGNSDVAFVNPLASLDAGGDAGGGRDGGLLARLQQDLLDRAPLREGDRRLTLAPDDSVVVIGAPSPRRELETVAAEIWAMVRADADANAGARDGVDAPAGRHSDRRQPWRFSDVAVLVAGSDEPYLSLARAVFLEAGDLPHNIVDAPLTATTHLIEAVLALLALPLGNLTRREVLDVITHPNVRARFPEVDPRLWLELCSALTIAHGADQAALADTYIEGDVFNWDQGLKRLALGVFARGARSGAGDPVELPAGPHGPAAAYLPAEVATDLRPHADALALLVRSLLADTRFARQARLTVSDWTHFVRALMASYVVPTNPDDEATRLLVFTALDQLASQSTPDLTVGLGVAVELMRAALTGLRGSRGQILGAGVAVGTLASLRAVPFRAIFVVGLDPDRFPAADRPSPFDLESDHRWPGNVSPRQRDRGLFLEAMLAAREHLVLSHVDRDPLTGVPGEPSPIVLELLEQLRRGYLADDEGLTRRAPLHRDDDARVRAAFPAAAAEGQARVAGDALRAAVPEASRLSPSLITGGLSPAARQTLAPLLRTVDAPAAPADGGETADRRERRVLRLTDLRRFLECPLQGSARVFLGLRDLPDDSEERETEDEPFDIPRMFERGLLGDIFVDAWNEAGPPDAARLAMFYDEGASRRRRDGVLPAGLFRASVRNRHLRILEQWAATIAASERAPTGPARRICFGRPAPFAPLAELRDALRLRLDLAGRGSVDVELHGTTEPRVTVAGTGASMVLATADDGGRNEKDDKDALRAFLDHVALAASAPEGAGPLESSALLCRPPRSASVSTLACLPFAPLDVATARAYLANLVGEMLAGIHAYLFPCEAVFRSLDRRMSLVDRIEQVRTDDWYRRFSSSNRGPVPEPFDYPTPSAAQAETMLVDRFGLFLRHHRSTVTKDAPKRDSTDRTDRSDKKVRKGGPS